MALAEKIKKFLDEAGVRYEILQHERALTAQEVAHAVHITGKEVAKCVVLHVDGKMVMVTVPAPRRVNLEKARSHFRAKEIRLAREDEFRELFPESELGAMPPIGPAYGLPVCMDASLEHYPEVIFNACTHTEVVRMSLKDFVLLVKPMVGDFSEMPS